jgi:hypothetical protein
MLKNSDPKNPQMAKLKRAIGDPKAAEKMLNNPDTARIIKNLGNK